MITGWNLCVAETNKEKGSLPDCRSLADTAEAWRDLGDAGREKYKKAAAKKNKWGTLEKVPKDEQA